MKLSINHWKNLKDQIGSNKIDYNKAKKHNSIIKKVNAPPIQRIIEKFVASSWFLHQP